MVEVDADTLSTSRRKSSTSITPRTKAMFRFTMFGQSCDMEAIMQVAEKHDLLSSKTTRRQSARILRQAARTKKAGTIGHIGTTSFFRSKNLGCYGDGGAIFTTTML
jgi:dTDP-4-amino-4,6-dideoxygalactose transaminase